LPERRRRSTPPSRRSIRPVAGHAEEGRRHI
jgi:hypothetical protein